MSTMSSLSKFDKLLIVCLATHCMERVLEVAEKF